MAHLFPSFPTLEESREIARHIMRKKYSHMGANSSLRGFDTYWNAAVASKKEVSRIVGDDLRVMAGCPFPIAIKDTKEAVVQNIAQVWGYSINQRITPEEARVRLRAMITECDLRAGVVTEGSPLLEIKENHVGTKIKAALRAFATTFLREYLPTLHGEYIERAASSVEAIIPNEKATWVLSFNPLDILLASTHAAYSSCHSLTGEYCTGPVHYALFPYVGIVFLTKNRQKISTWAPEVTYPYKMARCMAFFYPKAVYLAQLYAPPNYQTNKNHDLAKQFTREVARRWLPPESQIASAQHDSWHDPVSYLKGYREGAVILQKKKHAPDEVDFQRYPSPQLICPNCARKGGFSNASYFCELCAWSPYENVICHDCRRTFPRKESLCDIEKDYCPQCDPTAPKDIPATTVAEIVGAAS